eukprot:3119612-Heterocapsa_arctica.AAC.1
MSNNRSSTAAEAGGASALWGRDRRPAAATCVSFGRLSRARNSAVCMMNELRKMHKVWGCLKRAAGAGPRGTKSLYADEVSRRVRGTPQSA